MFVQVLKSVTMYKLNENLSQAKHELFYVLCIACHAGAGSLMEFILITHHDSCFLKELRDSKASTECNCEVGEN